MTISDQDRRDGLYEATLNEADRRNEAARLRAEMERIKSAKTALHTWGAMFLTFALAAFAWFDHKLEGHLVSTDAAREVGLENARTIAVQAKISEAQTLWIQEIQRALEPIRDRQNKFELQLNDVQHDVSNLKGPKR